MITIVHELSGRLRIKMSHPLKDSKHLEYTVKGHPGIFSVGYTPVTRSVLIQFNPQQVTREEIILRVGLSYSLEYDSTPVQVFSEQNTEEMSDSAFYSGFLLAVAFINRLVNRNYKSGSWLEWTMGLGTTWSVLEHGASEVKNRGNFDPEVLSVVYLLTALLRGNFLPAAIFTWLTTFGRHLIHKPAIGIELCPMEFTDKDAEIPSYEMAIHPVSKGSEKQMWLNLLPSIVKYAATGRGEGGQSNLIDEIQRVAKFHGEVIEGLGGFRTGIPVKIR